MKKLHHKLKEKNLVLYFQVHQPLRLNRFKFFDIGKGSGYFDEKLNDEILERVAMECYLPANMLLLKLIKKNPELRVAFSVSGITLDKLNEITPEVLYSFRALAETGAVEFLGETQYHSLACMIPGEEFEAQVTEHRNKIEEYLGVRPVVFRNTELIYNDTIAARVRRMGFNGIFCDGLENILGYRSPHHLYEHHESDLKIFLRNYRLSDDIAFRFNSGKTPLTVDTYLSWLGAIPADQSLVTIALDYETFGEHQKKSTGIFLFLESLLSSLCSNSTFRMTTPSEALVREKPVGKLSVPMHVSWADQERDLSAWLGNPIQQDAFETLISLGDKIKRTGDPLLEKCWRMLQTSDHFYYMSTKKGDDGNVHSYFSPFPSPYEAFINYMNVLSDFSLLIDRRMKTMENARRRVPTELAL
jgi:alpha-amylase